MQSNAISLYSIYVVKDMLSVIPMLSAVPLLLLLTSNTTIADIIFICITNNYIGITITTVYVANVIHCC